MHTTTLGEIDCYGSLDEKVAVEHFLGKNLQQAEVLFAQNFSCYMEDLMWMGPRAFCYYVQAAISYLKSASAFGDSDAVIAFMSAVQVRLANDSHEIRDRAPLLAEACGFVLGHWESFKMDTGDAAFRDRYGELQREFARIAEQPTTGA